MTQIIEVQTPDGEIVEIEAPDNISNESLQKVTRDLVKKKKPSVLKQNASLPLIDQIVGL